MDSPSSTLDAGALDVLRLLFPDPSVIGPGVRRRADREFIALPRASAARMLLPEDGRLAAACLRRARRPVSRRSRITTTLTCLALRAGAGRLSGARFRVTGQGDNIEDLLAEVVGQPVRVGVFLGPPRANRKPVLQVLSPAGELIAVAKVGMNDLTRSLARAEGAALERLQRADLEVTQTPRVLALQTWNGLEVLVQSALPIWEQGMPVNTSTRHAAMREISTLDGSTQPRWGVSPYRAEITDKVEALPGSEVRRACLEALTRIDPDLPLRHGAWHGDLTAWNMATHGERALVWDWERFSTCVPVGFDFLHYDFLPMLKVADRRTAGVRLLRRADDLLRPAQVDLRAAHDIAVLYLVEIATRFTGDRQESTGVAGGDASEWLVPALGQGKGASRG